MTDRVPLIAGNWKMNGTCASALELASGLVAGLRGHPGGGGRQWLVCPPFVHLHLVKGCLRQATPTDSGAVFALGAQNLAVSATGALTGEVSASMLLDAGCTWVILGHSERRTLLGETDTQILAKLQCAQAAGLHSIICVGETAYQRESQRTMQVIEAQLEALLPALQGASVEGFNAAEVVIAYEPIWAIGTGRSATAELAQEVHAAVRNWLTLQGLEANATRIIYGGSVKPATAAQLLAMADIDGVLVGGASLSVGEFLGIGGLSSRP
jgi:triosephosphate isomerase